MQLWKLNKINTKHNQIEENIVSFAMYLLHLRLEKILKKVAVKRHGSKNRGNYTRFITLIFLSIVVYVSYDYILFFHLSSFCH